MASRRVIAVSDEVKKELDRAREKIRQDLQEDASYDDAIRVSLGMKEEWDELLEKDL